MFTYPLPSVTLLSSGSAGTGHWCNDMGPPKQLSGRQFWLWWLHFSSFVFVCFILFCFEQPKQDRQLDMVHDFPMWIVAPAGSLLPFWVHLVLRWFVYVSTVLSMRQELIQCFYQKNLFKISLLLHHSSDRKTYGGSLSPAPGPRSPPLSQTQERCDIFTSTSFSSSMGLLWLETFSAPPSRLEVQAPGPFWQLPLTIQPSGAFDLS